MTFRNILDYFVWRGPAEAYTEFITLHKILSNITTSPFLSICRSCSYFSMEPEIYRENYSNNMVTNDLAPWVASSSAALLLF